MKKILMVVLLACLIGCQPKEEPSTENGHAITKDLDGIINERAPDPEEGAEHAGQNLDENDQLEDSDSPVSQEDALVEDSIQDLLPDDFVPKTYVLEPAFPDLTFDKPLYLTGYEDWIFVVEKGGVIYKFKPGISEEKEIFLDISSQVGPTNSELGLLGFALDPEFKTASYVYVYYTSGMASVISRLSVNPYMMQVRRGSEEIIMTFDQPYSNHNGGHLAFGRDQLLYIGSGDGGSSGDPMNNGQNLMNPLGKILRIDVKNVSPSETYRIPDDNPFKGNTDGYDETIFAYGLRNPWRFSFDVIRNLLIVADVGQDTVEEIDIVELGKNYGWPKYEGTSLYKALEIEGDVIMPIWEYRHPIGKSVTGGYTYYGQKSPSLYGVYIYGDFITGRIWGLWLNEDLTVSNYELLDSDMMIASFGYVEGEIYIVDYRGKIYQLQERDNP